MEAIIKGEKRVFLGRRKSDNAAIYLYKPSWDCDWYWGFGYLGNSREHSHLDGYAKGRNINMRDALLEDYNLNPRVEKQLWVFCELVQTAYTLKKTTEVLGRGGSHYTTNPLSDLIKNTDEVKRINEVVLPEIFNAISELFEKRGYKKTK